MPRLQCNICGEKSILVDNPRAVTRRELQALIEFRNQHAITCSHAWGDSEGLVSLQTPPTQCGPFGSEKPPPLHVARPHGHGEYTGPYGEIQHVDYLSCCHCRRMFEVRAGWDKTLGKCYFCFDPAKPGSGITCARPECAAHIPYEVRLDNCDAGIPELTPAASRVSVPALPENNDG